VKAIKGRVLGIVQGVGFRYSVKTAADRLGVKGWVRNEFNGSVSFHAEGDTSQLESFRRMIESSPGMSRVQSVQITNAVFEGMKRFSIK
jgi:acylphosphatase